MENVITFENDALELVVKIAKEKGYKVFGFAKPGQPQKQVFIENEKKQVGTCSARFGGGISFGTCHRPCTHAGTGYGHLRGKDFDNPHDIDICFIHAPFWGSSKGVTKWKSFDEYRQDNINAILNYYEI